MSIPFLDQFVQFLAGERREVEVLILNPLVLTLLNGDSLPFHRNARYARYTYPSFARTWGCGLSVERV